MNKLLILPLFAACANAAPIASDDTPSSLRERLEQPTRLLISGGTGAITVGHYVNAEWTRTRVDLPIASGEVIASTDGDGRVIISGFGLGFDALTLPIHDDTQLSQVRLDLSAPAAPAPTTWHDEDTATASSVLAIVLAWSLTVDGATSPLGPQAFPAIPLDLALGGDGAVVQGALSIEAPGTLWSWASLVELDDLSLKLDAATR